MRPDVPLLPRSRSTGARRPWPARPPRRRTARRQCARTARRHRRRPRRARPRAPPPRRETGCPAGARSRSGSRMNDATACATGEPGGVAPVRKVAITRTGASPMRRSTDARIAAVRGSIHWRSSSTSSSGPPPGRSSMTAERASPRAGAGRGRGRGAAEQRVERRPRLGSVARHLQPRPAVRERRPELPAQPGLADAGFAGHDDRPSPRLRAGGESRQGGQRPIPLQERGLLVAQVRLILRVPHHARHAMARRGM